MDFFPGVKGIPLRHRDAQEKIGVGKGCPSTVAPYEDIEHSLNVLALLLVVGNDGLDTDGLVESV